MTVIDCEQYSDAWWSAHRGVPTASRFAKIVTPKLARYSASAAELICRLIAETLTTEPLADQGAPESYAIRRGNQLEPEARRWYEFECGLDVRQVGLCLTDDGRFGCSPDGLVGEDGGLELKCPLPATHVAYLLEGKVPDDYMPQVHGSLIVTGRKWWEFVSYCPGLPSLRVRVTPTDYTRKLELALEQFWADYQAALGRFKTLGAA